jgi:hypothetical protein
MDEDSINKYGEKPGKNRGQFTYIKNRGKTGDSLLISKTRDSLLIWVESSVGE